MENDRFAWFRPLESGVIDAAHPDYATLIELDDVERWIADGAPPIEPTAPPLPAVPVAPEIPAVALAVSRKQAAALLSISVDTFERRVLPHLRVAQIGSRQLVPIRELEAFLATHAAKALR